MLDRISAMPRGIVLIKDMLSPYPMPMTAIVEEHAGDMEVGGFHLMEVHISMLLGGRGVLVLVLLVILFTQCCLKGVVQDCLVNLCLICCSGWRGEGRRGTV